MSNQNDTTPSFQMSMADLEKSYGLQLPDTQEGTVVDAEIVLVNEDAGLVFCSIPGVKAEGEVPLEDFDEMPEIGTSVKVLVKKKEGRNGKPILSKKEAEKNSVLANLSSYQVNQEPIEGVIEVEVKGGFLVKLSGNVEAFLPASHLDVSRVEDVSSYIGKTFEFLVDRVNYGRNGLNIVVSRKNLLQKDVVIKREAFFNSASVGDVIKGRVKNFTLFGAFIDLGGFDGLLHINDISWGHVKKIDDYIEMNQELDLKVVKLDFDNDRINLSLKHMKEDPWETFEDRYTLDQRVSGKVSKITNFGAFVELEEGIEGLIHISELSWVKKVQHPKSILDVDQEVECVILGYDIEEERISLGLKQAMENPWDTIEDILPLNAKVKGEVVKIVSSGAVVAMENGMEAFLPIQELSWTGRVKNAGSFFKEGDSIDCLVLDISKDEHKIRLGYKQLTDDPWSILISQYGVGSEIKGTVSSITDFGIFVKVEGDIEGLVHRNQLSTEPVAEGEDPTEKFKIGDEINSAIISIDAEAQRLSLSIRQISDMKEKREMSRYIDSAEKKEESTGATMADFMGKE